MKSNRLPGRETVGAWATPAVLLVTYVVALALLVVSALVDYRIATELQDDGKPAARTIEAMEKLRQVGNAFYVAESSQRGYVLTGKDDYLEPYREIHRLIDTRLDETGRLISDTPSQRERLITLRSLGARRFSQMDRTLDAYRATGLASAAAVVGTDDGMETMVRVRTTIRAMLNEEADLLATRRAVESEAASSGRVKSLLASVVVVLSLSVFYLLTLRFLRHPRSSDDRPRLAGAPGAERPPDRAPALRGAVYTGLRDRDAAPLGHRRG